MTDSGKHSSLLRHGNNYYCKKFYCPGPWCQCHKRSVVVAVVVVVVVVVVVNVVIVRAGE